MLSFSEGGRMECVDAAKAIAIIAIVVGHTICIDEIPYVHATINSFHVPAFFIIAGFFVRDMGLKSAVRKYASVPVALFGDVRDGLRRRIGAGGF